MKLIKLTCPNCGAKLDVELQDGKTELYCQYCGQKILVNPDYIKEININQNIHKTYTDEAKIKKVESDAKIKSEKLQEQITNRKHRELVAKAELIVGIILLAIGLLGTLANSYLGFLIFIGPVFIMESIATFRNVKL